MKKEKTKLITSIGGQALMEGIMMRGPKKTTAAVRKPDGSIELEEIHPLDWAKKYKILRLPLIRGVVNMIDSLVTGEKALMLSADKALEDDGSEEEEELSKFDIWVNNHLGDKAVNVIMAISTFVAIVFCIGVFYFLPTYLYDLTSGFLPGLKATIFGIDKFWRPIFEGVIRIALFLVYMCLCTLNKDIKRVFQYHGAEHKTIFCYEYGLDLTVENVRKQRRFHPRCGTSFMILMLIVGIIIGFFIRIDNLILRSTVKLLLLPLTVGIGYELIKVCGRHDNIITRIISAPGVWMQHITTKEPTDDMIAVAIRAMEDVIPENGEDRIG
ncbi:MAG: DUF1385 domain-containing protein [Clostridia bacterium]|nr:DUF1385 domain-containing protein [Clostridia bacterium]